MQEKVCYERPSTIFIPSSAGGLLCSKEGRATRDTIKRLQPREAGLLIGRLDDLDFFRCKIIQIVNKLIDLLIRRIDLAPVDFPLAV